VIQFAVAAVSDRRLEFLHFSSGGGMGKGGMGGVEIEVLG
jgi:hypothetical protein